MEIYIKDKVKHPNIKEEMTVVGIREHELELASKWAETAWYKKEGFEKVIPFELHTSIRLSSGKFFDFAHPSADDIDIEDVAQGLATEYRYAGQTKTPYSVAQHAVYCSLEAGTIYEQFERLHHDDTEAIMKDIPKPLKNLLRDYQTMEDKVQNVLMGKFGIPFPLSESCHRVDREIFEWEYNGMMLNKFELEYWDVETAKDIYLSRHYNLLKAIENDNNRKEKSFI